MYMLNVEIHTFTGYTLGIIGKLSDTCYYFVEPPTSKKHIPILYVRSLELMLIFGISRCCWNKFKFKGMFLSPCWNSTYPMGHSWRASSKEQPSSKLWSWKWIFGRAQWSYYKLWGLLNISVKRRFSFQNYYFGFQINYYHEQYNEIIDYYVWLRGIWIFVFCFLSELTPIFILEKLYTCLLVFCLF